MRESSPYGPGAGKASSWVWIDVFCIPEESSITLQCGRLAGVILVAKLANYTHTLHGGGACEGGVARTQFVPSYSVHVHNQQS